MFDRFKDYRKRRELAHNILGELLPEKDADLHKQVGTNYFITTPDGSTLFQDERLGFRKLQRGYIGFSSLKVIFKIHSEQEIVNALNLLISNNHIEINDENVTKRDQVAFAISPTGRIALESRFYKKFNYERRTFWIQVVVGTLLALVAILLTINKN